jgi:hypothetical protein
MHRHGQLLGKSSHGLVLAARGKLLTAKSRLMMACLHPVLALMCRKVRVRVTGVVPATPTPASTVSMITTI